MKLGEIAERLGCRLEGESSTEITNVAGVEAAHSGDLTFVVHPRYRRHLQTTKASAVLVRTEEAIPPRSGLEPLAILRSSNPYLDFARAIDMFYPPPHYGPGVHPSAVIAPTARIGDGAHIGPYCFLDQGVQLGRNAVLHSFVVIYRNAVIGDDFFAHAHAVVREGCSIGNRVILQNGAIVGGDGFGFAKQADGRWYKMRQAGTAVIEDDVEIQSNTCVDRATVGETRIGRGVKLDDLVLVGHATRIGEDSLLCGQAGLAGSTVVGDRCILTGQVGVAGHLRIGDDSVITPQSGIPNDVPPGALYSGSPAVEHKNWLKIVAALNRLPELQRTVRELHVEVSRLRAKSAAT